MSDETGKSYSEDVTVSIQIPSNDEESDTTFIKCESELNSRFGQQTTNPLDEEGNATAVTIGARIIPNITSGMDTEVETRDNNIKEECLKVSNHYEELLEKYELDINEHDCQLKEATLEIAECRYMSAEVTDNVQHAFQDIHYEDLKPLQYTLHEPNFQIKEEVLDISYEYTQDFESPATTSIEIFEQDHQIKQEPVENVENILPDNVESNQSDIVSENNEKNPGNTIDDDIPGLGHVEAPSETIESDNGTRYECRYCELTFSKRYQRQGHSRSCRKTKFTFSCTICGAGYVTERGMQLHKNSHISDGQLQCPACDNMDDTEEELIKHIAEKHAGEKLFKCNTCKQSFTRMQTLKLHLRIHNRTKLLSCKMCTRKCKTKSSLILHMRVHIGARTVSCSICGRKCSTLWHLTQHQRTHNNLKFNLCPICAKKFTLRSNLMRHMRLHKNKKLSDPEACAVVKKSSYVDGGVVGLSVNRDVSLKEETLDLPMECEQILLAYENFDESMNVGDAAMQVYTPRSGEETRFTCHEKNVRPVPCDDAKQLESYENHADKVSGGVSSLKTEFVQSIEESMESVLEETFHIKQEELNIPFEYVQGFESHETTDAEINEHDYEMKRDPLENVEDISADNLECNQSDTYMSNYVLLKTPKNKTLYLCRYCELTFTKRKQLRGHLKVCRKTKYTYSCPICGSGYVTKKGIELHKNTHLCDGKLKCPACSKMYDTEEELTNHVLEHKGEKLFKCKKCDKSFTKERRMKIHYNVHNRLKLLSCSKCTRKFKLKSGLLRHLRSHCGPSPLSCDICSTDFTMPVVSKLANHICTHNLVQSIPCPICDKKFQLKYQLAYHMRTHNVSKRHYRCTICQDIFFPNEKSFTMHGLLSHNAVISLKCSTCGEVFPKQSTLLLHMAGHDMSTTPYSCETCEKTFNTLASWASHMRNNIWLKAFPCASCDKKFKTNRLLGLHVIIEHTNDTIHRCSLCGMTFRNNIKLSKHVLVQHKDEPSFFKMTSATIGNHTLPLLDTHKQTSLPVLQVVTCSKCSNVFPNELSYRQHTWQCHRYRPSQCPRCKRFFVTKQSWLDHTIDPNCVIRYECVVCKTAYVSLKTLSMHMMSHDSPVVRFDDSPGLDTKPIHLSNVKSISSANSLSGPENSGDNISNIMSNTYPESIMNRYSTSGSTSTLIQVSKTNAYSGSIGTPGNSSINSSIVKNNYATKTIYENNSINRLNVFCEKAERMVNRLPENISINKSIVYNKNSDNTGTINSLAGQLNNWSGTNSINSSTIYKKSTTISLKNASDCYCRNTVNSLPDYNSIVYCKNDENSQTVNKISGQLGNLPANNAINTPSLYSNNSGFQSHRLPGITSIPKSINSRNDSRIIVIRTPRRDNRSQCPQ